MRVSNAILIIATLSASLAASADAIRQTKGDYYDAFRQLDVDLPTPNVYRTASGAPGHEYWQQRANYKISATLDENARRVSASETISYTNNSPDSLRYVWLQLDQNRFANGSLEDRSSTASSRDGADSLSYGAMARHQLGKDVDAFIKTLKVGAR